MKENIDLSPYLDEDAQHLPAEAHVRSGYPIWTLVSVWVARGQSDEAVLREYALDPAEWAAAKAYYFAHKQAIDTRRAANDEPGPTPPGAILLEDLLAQRAEPPNKTEA